jgi:hypothetical protein
MKKINQFIFLFLLAFSLKAQEKATPIFKDGEAQIVEAFNDPSKWIRHDLWVETTFDSDGDGKLDRMHVGVTRPFQTETEGLSSKKRRASYYFKFTSKNMGAKRLYCGAFFITRNRFV